MIKHLRYFVLILPLAAGACPAPQPNETALKAIHELQAANVALDAAILAYDKLPFCGENPAPCADKKAILALGKAEDSAQIVLDKAEVVIRANPTIDAKALIEAGQAAFNAAREIATSYGVN